MPYSNKFENFIFDLDGTLVDTAPDLSIALNRVLDSVNRPPVDVDQVRHMVGGGARALIVHSLNHTGGLLSDDEIDKLHQMYLDYYSQNIAVDSKVFEGAERLLDTLAENDIAMGIATNKPQYLAKKLINELGMSHYFSSIKGWDEVTTPKPHQDHIMETLAEMGCSSENTLMVGDSETDQKAAHNAGIPVALVTFGYSNEPIKSFPAEIFVDNLSELERLFVKKP